MKEFCKDYAELWKHSGAFMKKHWKGLLVVNVAMVAAEVAWFAYQNKKFEQAINGSAKETETQD